MSEIVLNIDQYFERIGYQGNAAVNEETLMDLHLAHTTNVPFENLDVFYGKPILLDEASLTKKIVHGRRGGYCFEMNGIFSLVLQKLGFKVTNLLARVSRDGVNYSARTHQALLVEIGDRSWLADVGFGNDGIMSPLKIEENVDQSQFAHTYRLVTHPEFGYALQKKEENGDYRSMYALSLDGCYPVDFEMSNHFTSTYRESLFTQMRMCTMPTREGRITLTDYHLKIVTNGKVQERDIGGESEFKAFLTETFRLNLDQIIDAANQYRMN